MSERDFCRTPRSTSVPPRPPLPSLLLLLLLSLLLLSLLHSVLGSWNSGGKAMRIGLLIMYIHDVSDIFVDLLKMVNLSGLAGRAGGFASELAYASCIAAWCWYRFWQFPVRVLRCAIGYPFLVLGPPLPGGGGLAAALAQPPAAWLAYLAAVIRAANIPIWAAGSLMLLFLFALHLYWGFLLFRIGYRILTQSAREASRREYEGGDDDGDAAADDAEVEPARAGKPGGPKPRRRRQ